jgi:hypothetical protein
MRRPSSPANRYFAARLRTIGRPIFWGPAIVGLLLMLFTWDFWTNPSTWASLGIGNSRAEEEQLPPEDQSIGADIDSLPVLFSDIKSAPKPSASPDPKQDPLAKKKVTGGEAITTISTNGPGFGQTPQQATNPQGVYGVFGNALAERYGLSSAGNVMGESTPGLGVVKSTAPAMPSQSALQSAMSKFTTPTAAQATPTMTSVNGLANSPSAADTPSAGSAPFSNPAASAPATPQNSYTQLMGGSQPLQNYSNVRSAPMIPAASSELPTVSPAQLPAGFGQTAVPQPSTTPETTLQPFSVPRPIPGRSIGGGNINTFSNP